MNAAWSEKNKEMQKLLSRKDTFTAGKAALLELRADIFEQLTSIVNTCPAEAFYAQPYLNAKGYHSKTLAYSLWHIFRIEDIVAHTLILGDEQVLFSGDHLVKTGSPLVTTGNELRGGQIADFSRQLDAKAVLEYSKAVMLSTNALIDTLTFPDLKKRFTDADKARLTASGCVSEDEQAAWLIEYWCGKDVLGLIRMPFSRHWIMHAEAMLRIRDRLCVLARKGVDQTAYCGFSCVHCFLGAWCGSCRTAYNTCSFATCFKDRQCPNVTCCREKGLDGCWECPELLACAKGFYSLGAEGNAPKSQALFIAKYGKEEFFRVHDNLHKKYNFKKIQEIMDTDIDKGLRFLEENRQERP